jgi:hypothetical protein
MNRLLASSLVIALLSGCGSVYNYKDAYYTQLGDHYSIEVKGKRRLMAHDPVAILKGETYEASATFLVPRIHGSVAGNEIPRPKGTYNYLGSISFENSSMVIDLYADNYDNKTKDKVSWNGKYHLIPKNESGK